MCKPLGKCEAMASQEIPSYSVTSTRSVCQLSFYPNSAPVISQYLVDNASVVHASTFQLRPPFRTEALPTEGTVDGKKNFTALQFFPSSIPRSTSSAHKTSSCAFFFFRQSSVPARAAHKFLQCAPEYGCAISAEASSAESVVLVFHVVQPGDFKRPRTINTEEDSFLKLWTLLIEVIAVIQA